MLRRLVRACHVKSEIQNASRLFGIDDSVTMATSGGILCIQPSFVVCSCPFNPRIEFVRHGLTRGLKLLEIRAVHGLNCCIAFHYADAGGRPTEGEIRIESLTGHRVVSGSA